MRKSVPPIYPITCAKQGTRASRERESFKAWLGRCVSPLSRGRESFKPSQAEQPKTKPRLLKACARGNAEEIRAKGKTPPAHLRRAKGPRKAAQERQQREAAGERCTHYARPLVRILSCQTTKAKHRATLLSMSYIKPNSRNALCPNAKHLSGSHSQGDTCMQLVITVTLRRPGRLRVGGGGVTGSWAPETRRGNHASRMRHGTRWRQSSSHQGSRWLDDMAQDGSIALNQAEVLPYLSQAWCMMCEKCLKCAAPYSKQNV
jgi:hypothetical protein